MVVRKEVMDFSELMEIKLRKNDHKTDWKANPNPEWFFTRLLEEVDELRQAMKYERSGDIMEEAADVANFAMMIFDIYMQKEEMLRHVILNSELEYAEGEGVSGQIRTQGPYRQAFGR